jgi:hypothetical protein
MPPPKTEEPEPEQAPPHNSGDGDADDAGDGYTYGAKPHGATTERYIYKDARGLLFMRVTRTNSKTFPTQHWQDGRWINGWPATVIPYRLPELLAAPAIEPVWISEGEKDADNVAALGLIATTNPGGAKVWQPELAQWFKGKELVYVLEDNDDAGRTHTRKILAALTGMVPNIATVSFPELPEKGDVSDWLELGGNYDETRVKTNDDVQKAMHHAFCNSELKNRSQADKNGFHFGLTCYVQIGVDTTDDWSSISQWKKENCGQDDQNFSKQSEAEIIQKFVSPVTAQMYDACVRSLGLFCTITSPSPELILLQLDFTPYPGQKTTFATATPNSPVTNAKSSESGAKKPAGGRPGQVFGPSREDREIHVGGRTVQLERMDVKQPVSITINTDYGPCPQPLIVPAESDITAKVTINGTVEEFSSVSARRDVNLTNEVEHGQVVIGQCGVSNQTQNFCLPGANASLYQFQIRVS